MSTADADDENFDVSEFSRLKSLERDVSGMRRLQRQYLTQRGQVLFAQKLRAEQLVDTRLAQLRSMRSQAKHQTDGEP